MEARLLPVNAVLGLVTPGDVNPPALWDAGFVLAGLEVPIVGPDGDRVVVDLVLFHAGSSHLVLVEAKSGANIEAAQAARYASLDTNAIVQATRISLPRREQLTFEVVYVCLADYAERIQQGLDAVGMTGAVIRVSDAAISMDRKGAPTVLDLAWVDGPIKLAGAVARILPFDADSPSSEFDSAVRAQLVAELSRSRRQVTVRLLTELVVPHFPIFARRAQQQFVSKVRQSARTLVDANSDTFGYLPSTGTRPEDCIELLATPETRDPRGRTQAYQAMYGRRARPEGSEGRDPDLLDVLAENIDIVVGRGLDNGEEIEDENSALDDESIDGKGDV